jgi:hypothetical protein
MDIAHAPCLRLQQRQAAAGRTRSGVLDSARWKSRARSSPPPATPRTGPPHHHRDALIETSAAWRDLIFRSSRARQHEKVLDRKAADQRLWPPSTTLPSDTRKEELLWNEALEKSHFFPGLSPR